MPSTPFSLMGDPTNPNTVSGGLQGAASNLLTTGSDLTNTGLNSLGPVLDRLTKLLSGNPGEVDQATKPQVTSILKQYDTAKRTRAEFAPRGGGQTAGNAAAGAQEASDIGNVKSTAVNDAGGLLAQIATALTGQGLQAQSTGMQGFAELLQGAFQGEAITSQTWSAIGTGLAMLALAI